jgi:5-methylcytosine-specific restriction endonuclease McrA
MKKIKINKKQLYRDYITFRISVYKLVKKYKCCIDTIYDRLNKYNIRIRTNSEAQKKYYDYKGLKKLLIIEYIKKEKSIKEISKENKIGVGTIFRLLKKFKIKTRPKMTDKIRGKLSISTKKRFKNPKNHPNWKGGKDKEPYGWNWTEQLKESIRKRDNYTCQNCSMTEEEHLIVMGISLAIHHIDYNKKNCNEENLITLCNQCNIRANYDRDYWKNFYEEKIKKILLNQKEKDENI